MRTTLTFLDHRTVHLDSGTFFWVSIKSFQIDGNASDETLLADLIAHLQYRDTYAAPASESLVEASIHGKFRLGCISVDSFVPYTHEEVQDDLEQWTHPVEHNNYPDFDTVGLLKSAVLPLLANCVLYKLANMSNETWHEWGWVVGHGGFHEYVAIDRRVSTLLLIVASDD